MQTRRSPRWSWRRGSTSSSSCPKAGTSGIRTTGGCSPKTSSAPGRAERISTSTVQSRSTSPRTRTRSTPCSSGERHTMDLSTWLNFVSPGGPCFDLATLPIPGSPVSLAMIDALVEAHVRSRGDEITILEIGSFCGISTLTWGYALERLGISNYTIYCVDIWYHRGEVKYSHDKLEVLRARNSFNHEIFKFNIAQSIGLSHVVEVIGDSRVGLARLRDGFFDVVY